MCLDIVLNEKVPDGVYWKVFDKQPYGTGNLPRNPFYHTILTNEHFFQYDKEYESKSDYDLPTKDGPEYPSGIHAFTSEQDARRFCSNVCSHLILQVKLMECLAVGIQDGMRCVVFKRMVILKPSGAGASKKD
jgi:hypothetical protein